MKNQKKSRILFPAATFGFICIRLGSTELLIAKQEYLSFIISLIFPFVLFYSAEIIRYFRKSPKDCIPDGKDLGGALIILAMGIFYLFSLCSAPYSTIQFK